MIQLSVCSLSRYADTTLTCIRSGGREAAKKDRMKWAVRLLSWVPILACLSLCAVLAFRLVSLEAKVEVIQSQLKSVTSITRQKRDTTTHKNHKTNNKACSIQIQKKFLRLFHIHNIFFFQSCPSTYGSFNFRIFFLKMLNENSQRSYFCIPSLISFMETLT